MTCILTYGKMRTPRFRLMSALKTALLCVYELRFSIFVMCRCKSQRLIEQYRPVQFRLLQTATSSTIDSLSAFFAGMQVLGGDIESAIKSHLVFWNLWRKFDAMPESWAWEERRIEWGGYPGRPEFIESTYYLYQVNLPLLFSDWLAC